jgi:hypothetical protein
MLLDLGSILIKDCDLAQEAVMSDSWGQLPHHDPNWCRNCCAKTVGLEGRYCPECQPNQQVIWDIDRQIDELRAERSKAYRRLAYRRRKWRKINMVNL